jgi:TPR repeat protein
VLGGKIIARIENGDAQAQFELARWYEWHAQHELHKQDAFEWFKSAAEQGHLKAQAKLARCYMNGMGCEANNELFLKWVRLAADRGNADAQVTLGLHYMWPIEDGFECAKWLEKAADQGDGWGCYFFAGCYLDENEKHTPESIEWLLKAAKQQVSTAQSDLAKCYTKGEGVERDLVQAYAWVRVVLAEEDLGGKKKAGNPKDRRWLKNLARVMSPEEITKAKVLAREYVKKYRGQYDEYGDLLVEEL